MLFCTEVKRLAADSLLYYSGQIDAAHFQPTEVGFVAPAEAFRPAGGGAPLQILYFIDKKCKTLNHRVHHQESA
jgi:hypothetical protein